jgi:cytochrome c553
MTMRSRNGLGMTMLAGLGIIALAGTADATGDVRKGRQKALQCQTCHGLDGLSKIPEAPHIAGHSVQYIVKALTEYQTGARKNEMMSLIAPMLKPEDIDDLAAYYSAIEVSVVLPK